MNPVGGLHELAVIVVNKMGELKGVGPDVSADSDMLPIWQTGK